MVGIVIIVAIVVVGAFLVTRKPADSSRELDVGFDVDDPGSD
jgi:hypothetical protein